MCSSDLYRLNVITIALPPLRTRRQDIPLLIDHFLRALAVKHGRGPVALDEDAEAMLLEFDWPGNVRQLLNVLERALVLAAQDVIGPEHLSPELRGVESAGPEPGLPGGQAVPMVALAEIERQHVLAVLGACHGNRDQASQVLKISRRTLTRMLQRWRIAPAPASPS